MISSDVHSYFTQNFLWAVFLLLACVNISARHMPRYSDPKLDKWERKAKAEGGGGGEGGGEPPWLVAPETVG